MAYEPSPLNTDAVELPDYLLRLTEELARHTHEVWARQRLADGWVWGEARDDVRKHHPCLIPYDELPESEKEYDRNVALEAAKAIVSMGYQIVPPATKLEAGHLENDEALVAAQEILVRIAHVRRRGSRGSDEPAERTSIRELWDIWSARSEKNVAWRCCAEIYRQLGQLFLELGEPHLACEVSVEALQLNGGMWGEDIVLRQVYALGLARSGSPLAAQQELVWLRNKGALDEETLGVLARTHKDLANLAPRDAPERRKSLTKAIEIYRAAYQKTGGFWTGINVATLERLLGNESAAEQTAEAVRKLCLLDLERQRAASVSENELYWHLATLGEVELVLGRFEEAGRFFREAYATAPTSYGHLNSTRRQARWLLEFWGDAGVFEGDVLALLDDWLPLPKVVVFVGHLIDPSGSEAPRFPPSLVEPVKKTIRRWLEENNAVIGFSSAACGADLLFQESIQELNGESHLVIPYDEDEFVTNCVACAGDEWVDRYQRVVDHFSRFVIASPNLTGSDGLLYHYSNCVMSGLALLKARDLNPDSPAPVGLVVWDGKAGEGFGGTGSFATEWREKGLELFQIDVSQPVDLTTGELPVMAVSDGGRTVPRASAPDPVESNTEIRALLFGDAVHFSGLDENQVSEFVTHFMAPIGDIVDSFSSSNCLRNTWGDGLFLVFERVEDAGKCALQICQFISDRIESGEWSRLNLPDRLNIRLALHAGPLKSITDPITGLRNYVGNHVSRAARLEPRTPPGEVYASQAFAALCAEDRVTDFSCRYVKQLDWAKHYGSFPTFVLRNRI